MANEKITPANIHAFLGYLSQMLGKPAGEGPSWNGLSQEEINRRLPALYEVLGISKMRGWKYENSFADTHTSTDNYGYEAPVPEATIPPPVVFRYEPVEQGLGRQNYIAYIKWLEDKAQKPVNYGIVSSWDQYSDQAIRDALPALYQDMSLLPSAAKSFEKDFLATFGTPSVPAATPRPAPAPKTTAPGPAPQKTIVSRSRKPVLVPVVIILALLLAAGGWVAYRYRQYNDLPVLYPLTDNIALRGESYDAAPIKGRMDLFGHYLDKGGEVKPSVSFVKMLDETPTGGFYKVTTGMGFGDYLLGRGDVVYVHSALVTYDKTVYDEERSVFENLAESYNEMDKLPLAYRNLVVRAFGAQGALHGARLAAACNPAKTLSKTAPVSVGKYKDKTNDVLYAVVRSTDGAYYVVSGKADGTATVSKINFHGYDGPPAAAVPAGMFRPMAKNSSMLFLDVCDNGSSYFGQPPYTDFYLTEFIGE